MSGFKSPDKKRNLESNQPGFKSPDKKRNLESNQPYLAEHL